MNSRKLVLLALTTAFLATGCDGFGTPQGVVATAAKALAENDPKLFAATLRDEAREEYGDLEGTIELQKYLGAKKLKLTKAKYLSELKYEDFREGACDSVSLYAVDVVEASASDVGREGSLTAENQTLLTTEVKCCFTRGSFGAPSHDGFPSGGTPDSNFCQISKITKAQ